MQIWLKDDDPEGKENDGNVGGQHLPAEHRLRKFGCIILSWFYLNYF